MSLKRLRRSLFTLWFGIFTLAVSGVEQNQLAGNVMLAAVVDGGAHADSTVHPADCPMHSAGGHTHKGHADCAVCGVLAALTAVTLPVVAIPMLPRERAEASRGDRLMVLTISLPPSPYHSRAPPSAI
jgi:hypothetical protein